MPFGNLHAASIYLSDLNRGANDGSYNETGSYQAGIPYLYIFPNFQANAVYRNKRTAFVEELRLSSSAGSQAKWVVGLFYSTQKTISESHDYTNLAEFAPALHGVSDTIVYGSPVSANGDVTDRFQILREEEVAAFADLTYPVSHNLRVIGGVRGAQNRFSYDTRLAGSFFGYAVPTQENGGLSAGFLKEIPVSPKIGVQFDIDGRNMAYATAAKGFRMGGINTGPYQFKCQSTFSALGISDTPRTYSSDTLERFPIILGHIRTS